MKDREEVLAIYEEVIAMCSGFKRKGKTMPYTSSNGYMFSQLNKDGQLGFRLPKEEGHRFIQKYNSGPFFSYGSVMKEYVVIPEELLENKALLASFLQSGFEYVNGLDPK